MSEHAAPCVSLDGRALRAPRAGTAPDGGAASESPPRRARGTGRTSWIPLATLALLACGERAPTEVEITRARTYAPEGDELRLNAPTLERLGLAGATGPAARADAEALDALHWETPPGWEELPPTPLRQANFRLADGAECYLTLLAGDGGGIAANVNRWRKQMGLAPLAEGDVAALPRARLLDREGPLLDVEGVFGGMDGDDPRSGWRLVGIATAGGGSSAFLKLVGPAETVEAELSAFLALAGSFHPASSHGASSHAAEPAEAPPERGQSSTLTFEVPAGWTRGPERSMREVTFAVGEGAECYVALLGGDGGGVLPNVNRWLEQLGAEPLEDLAALERLPVLGTEAVVVDALGSFAGMEGESVEDARLFGAVALLGDFSVFVKLVGPRAVVDPEREAFLGFCRSLAPR